jgi:hypothetical protein
LVKKLEGSCPQQQKEQGVAQHFHLGFQMLLMTKCPTSLAEVVVGDAALAQVGVIDLAGLKSVARTELTEDPAQALAEGLIQGSVRGRRLLADENASSATLSVHHQRMYRKQQSLGFLMLGKDEDFSVL